MQPKYRPPPTPEGREAEFAALVAALEDARRVQARRARDAATKLRALLATVRSRDEPTRVPLRRISLLVEDWQLDAARLIAAMRGGSYQESMRTWIGLGIHAEAQLAARPAAREDDGATAAKAPPAPPAPAADAAMAPRRGKKRGAQPRRRATVRSR